MRHRMLALFPLLIALAPPAAVADAPAPAPMAPYWTVHVDEVQPQRAAEFERLNIAENRGIHAILRAHGQPIRPVYEIVTRHSVYMSLRPKKSISDIETPSAVPDSVSRLFATVTDTLDDRIHAALKVHYNQIWRYHRLDSYTPGAPAARLPTPGYIQMIRERTIPGQEGRWSALVDSMRAALVRQHYPWPMLVFTSSYGDGATIFLFQADSKEAFLAAGDRAAVLTKAFGPAKAKSMLAEWRRTLASSEVVDAAPHRAYSDLDDSVPWLGMPQP